MPGVLGNYAVSGTEVLVRLGPGHLATGGRSSTPPPTALCRSRRTRRPSVSNGSTRSARSHVARGRVHVGRVIARPFLGDARHLRAHAQPARLHHPAARADPAGPRRRGRRPRPAASARSGTSSRTRHQQLDKGATTTRLPATHPRRWPTPRRRRPALRQLRRLRHALRPPARRRRATPRCSRPSTGACRADGRGCGPAICDHHRRSRQRPDLSRHRPHPRARAGAGPSASEGRRNHRAVGLADIGGKDLAAHLGLAAGRREDFSVTAAGSPKVEFHLPTWRAARRRRWSVASPPEKHRPREVLDEPAVMSIATSLHFLEVYEAGLHRPSTPEEFRRPDAAVLERSRSLGRDLFRNLPVARFLRRRRSRGLARIPTRRSARRAEAARPRRHHPARISSPASGISAPTRRAGAPSARRDQRATGSPASASPATRDAGAPGTSPMTFDMAREAGLRLTAHAGEWGGPQ